MTQEEIIEMARQADCLHVNLTGDRAKALERLEAFAKLVEEKAFQNGYSIGESAGFKEGVKLERKARRQA